jgi:hypothetical protein
MITKKLLLFNFRLSIYEDKSLKDSIPRFGIPRLQPGVECGVIRGRSRYPLLRGMNSTYKYYGTVFVIFEFHSFDPQASVADDLQVMHFVSGAWVSLFWGASGSCGGAPLTDGIINNATVSPTYKKPFDLIAKGLFC